MSLGNLRVLPPLDVLTQWTGTVQQTTMDIFVGRGMTQTAWERAKFPAFSPTDVGPFYVDGPARPLTGVFL